MASEVVVIACPYRHADACDQRASRGLPGVGMARLGRSEVCDGRGVFAACGLLSGTPVTAYAGVGVATDATLARLRRRPSADTDYMYERVDGLVIDGNPRILRGLSGRRSLGCANMVNDALHPEVTRRTNNCVFEERSGAVYLVTARDVAAGEELLVSYGFDYWLSRLRSALLPLRVREWVRCHGRTQEALEGITGRGCMPVDYKSCVSDRGKTPYARYTFEFDGHPGCRCPGASEGRCTRRVEMRRVGGRTTATCCACRRNLKKPRTG